MRGASWTWVTAALALAFAGEGANAMQDSGNADIELRRHLIKSQRGLKTAVGDYLAEVRVESETECDAVKTAIEELVRDSVTARRQLRVADDEGDDPSESVRSASIAETFCSVAFTGDGDLLEAVQALPAVIDVEDDKLVIMEASPRSWGLDRVDQADLPLSSSALEVSHDGIGVNVYIIDTGINLDHEDFTGRSVYGKSFIKGEGDEDQNGHGSHCAGTVGGATYGIATRATLFGVKVLSGSGSGSTSGVIDGINWAVKNQKETYSAEPAVLSLSLGGGKSTTMNNAVKAAAAAGHIVVVAAGNENQDACNVSPASAGGRASDGGVISVGSTTKTDHMSSFSNFGECTDVFAPGSEITSAWKGGKTASNTISGTSMACPHVAGVAAVLLQKHNKDKNAAQAELLSLLVANKVTNIGDDSPNLLLQVPTYTGPPTPPTQSPTMPPTNLPEKVCVGNKCPAYAASSYGPGMPSEYLLTAPLFVAMESPTLCEATDEDFTGKVVLVLRGGCLFFQKTKAAEKQGALAVVIMLASSKDSIFPPGYYGDDTTAIPTFMISKAGGDNFIIREGQDALIGSPSLPAYGETRPPTPPTLSPTPMPTEAPTTRPTFACSQFGKSQGCRRQPHCSWTVIEDFSSKNACYENSLTLAPTPAPTFFTPEDCKLGTYEEAEEFCSSEGKTICAFSALRLTGRQTNDACSFDNAFVWSSATCKGGKRKTFRRKGGKARCRNTRGQYAIRCC